MAGGSKRRWLVLAVVAGAGAWVARTKLSGPKGLTGPVRVLSADPAPAGPAPIAVEADESPAARNGTVPAPSPALAESVAPAASTATAAPEAPAWPDRPEAFDAPVAEPVAPPVPMPAVEPIAPDYPATRADPLHFAPPVAAAEPPVVRPSPSPRPSPAPRPVAASPAPAPPPMPSGQALFAPSDAVSSSGATPLPDGSAPGPEYMIKGNADSMLFHTPESPYFTRTKAEVWFRDAEEARTAGFTEWSPRKKASQ